MFFPHYSIIVKQASKQTNNILLDSHLHKKNYCAAMFFCVILCLNIFPEIHSIRQTVLWECKFKLLFHKIIDFIKVYDCSKPFTYNTIILTICLKDFYIRLWRFRISHSLAIVYLIRLTEDMYKLTAMKMLNFLPELDTKSTLVFLPTGKFSISLFANWTRSKHRIFEILEI